MNVRGVLVEVANRFWLAAGVILGEGVGEGVAGGMGVGVAMIFARSDKDAQLERRIDRIRT